MTRISPTVTALLVASVVILSSRMTTPGVMSTAALVMTLVTLLVAVLTDRGPRRSMARPALALCIGVALVGLARGLWFGPSIVSTTLGLLPASVLLLGWAWACQVNDSRRRLDGWALALGPAACLLAPAVCAPQALHESLSVRSGLRSRHLRPPWRTILADVALRTGDLCRQWTRRRRPRPASVLASTASVAVAAVLAGAVLPLVAGRRPIPSTDISVSAVVLTVWLAIVAVRQLTVGRRWLGVPGAPDLIGVGALVVTWILAIVDRQVGPTWALLAADAGVLALVVARSRTGVRHA
ncbi:hypothetical protein [Acidipropionibacterium timonense]|uniref:hypothetical protein n=1 Tax=Acidipropionibacterium timonense TaxID=2161818 RepID=UPI0010300589|nr:hypothetical protein [Acidipropionibacterium timonense]